MAGHFHVDFSAALEIDAPKLSGSTHKGEALFRTRQGNGQEGIVLSEMKKIRAPLQSRRATRRLRRPLRFRLSGLIAATAFSTLSASAVTHPLHCRINHGFVIVPARFGPVRGEWIVDPATPDSRLDQTAAGLAGLEGPLATQRLSFGVGGAQSVRTLAISPLDDLTRRADVAISGVLGADSLRGQVWAFRFQPCRIAVSFGTTGNRHRPAPTSVVWSLGRIAADVGISDGLTSRVSRMNLSLGRWPTRLTQAVPAISGVDAPLRLNRITLAGRTFADVPIEIELVEPGQAEGSVGVSVLSANRMILDLVQDRIWLTPERLPRAPETQRPGTLASRAAR